MTITPISVFSDYPVQFEKPEGCLDRLCSRGRDAASVGGRSHGWRCRAGRAKADGRKPLMISENARVNVPADTRIAAMFAEGGHLRVNAKEDCEVGGEDQWASD